MGTCVYLWEPMEKTAHGYGFFLGGGGGGGV